MDELSNAPQTTPSLPIVAGSKPAPWVSDRAFTASKPCAYCGKAMTPLIVKGYKGKTTFEVEYMFNQRQCCSQSCAKKLKNPMHNPGTRSKVAATLKKIGHKPPIQGGNGRGMTAPQEKMLDLLGPEWMPEYAEKTHLKSKDGYPHHYKIDLANPVMKIAVELDGFSHCAATRQVQDVKKDTLLRQLGWKVLRLPNAQAESMCTTYGSQVIHPILQMAS